VSEEWSVFEEWVVLEEWDGLEEWVELEAIVFCLGTPPVSGIVPLLGTPPVSGTISEGGGAVGLLRLNPNLETPPPFEFFISVFSWIHLITFLH